jgi:uncharacterized protein YndB with AHSA1/START domain
MTVDTAQSVEVEIFVAASPATVFGFFTEAEKMQRWMGIVHRLEARPGGLFHVHVRDGNIARGAFREIVPHRRIVFTWGWEAGGVAGMPPGSTVVEIDLAPERDGTRVKLTHRGLPAEAAARHKEGWTHFLGRLAIAGAGGDPGPHHPQGSAKR